MSSKFCVRCDGRYSVLPPSGVEGGSSLLEAHQVAPVCQPERPENQFSNKWPDEPPSSLLTVLRLPHVLEPNHL